MKTVDYKFGKVTKTNIFFVLNQMILLGMVLLFNLKTEAQEKVIPTIEVQTAFEKEFPNVVPYWTKNFGGEDLDQIRYNAKFQQGSSEVLAVYDNLGKMKAFEVSIAKKAIPVKALTYLNREYKGYTFKEAARVKDDKKVTTYEVGIIMAGKFYDAVFDKDGNFIKIIQTN
ncbi:hypothetical protein EZL74_05185 [Flavobacterium silvisoli]|uniref:Uncharacterized protein n=1 Tax=Flavobacterium silvisoli TaxID=2529433 RepID=A0A4Q9Z1K0_9FLAO|nr:hypothetical protein [Flavobacterium silvisoli]TBX70140.1 hypothetical protein EZL74_05185 [Flavobacterium silvisoli]